MLMLDAVRYEKNGAAIIDDIAFSVKPGEILGIIGPNGAGKTSVVRALLGDVKASGSIQFAGRSIAEFSAVELARHIAVLPQFSALNFPYSVAEVVLLGRTPHSSGRRIDTDIAHAAMAALDISYLSGRRYTDLSGGEKQRTQLARVMAQVWRSADGDPRLLILDEPTSSLDLGHKQQLMQIVRQFAGDKVAVLLIEHDLNVVANYADTLLALQCGRVMAYGSVQEHLTAAMVSDLLGAQVSVVQKNGVKTVLNTVIA
ncbi:MAG TPA: heme ABC transporter ATP-binding protein [Marinagarivorans sp.]